MSASITDNPLFIELFGTSETRETTAENLEGSGTNTAPWRKTDFHQQESKQPEGIPASNQQTASERQKDSQPVKENGQVNFSLYRLEVLRDKMRDFLDRMNKAGLAYTVKNCRVQIPCRDSDKRQERDSLLEILRNEPETEAMLILRVATTDRDLADCIVERACIRWADGYLSDSLFLAVLGDITPTGERPNKELKARTQWAGELKLLGFHTWPEGLSV